MTQQTGKVALITGASRGSVRFEMGPPRPVHQQRDFHERRERS